MHNVLSQRVNRVKWGPRLVNMPIVRWSATYGRQSDIISWSPWPGLLTSNIKYFDHCLLWSHTISMILKLILACMCYIFVLMASVMKTCWRYFCQMHSIMYTPLAYPGASNGVCCKFNAWTCYILAFHSHLLWYVHDREIPGRDTLRLICTIVTVYTMGLVCIIITIVINSSMFYRSFLHKFNGYERGIQSLMWLSKSHKN